MVALNNFIHIPKNAGTSVRYFVPDAIHAPVAHRETDWLKDSWCIVRNPYSRAISIFYQCTRMRPSTELLKKFWYSVLNNQLTCLGEPIPFILVQPQTFFMSELTHRLSFENVSEEFYLTFNKRLPVTNKSVQPCAYTSYLDHELISILNQVFDNDFKELTYRKI